jgi:phage-related protein
MSKTAAAQTQLLKNRFAILKVEVGEAVAPVFLRLVSIFSKVVGWFNNLSPGIKRLITNFALIGTALTIVGGIVLVIGGALMGLAAIFAALDPEVLAIVAAVGLVVAGFVALGVAIVKWYRTSLPVRAFVAGIKQDFVSMGQMIVQAWQKVVAAYNKDLKPALMNLWSVIQTRVLPVVMAIADYFMNTVVKAFRSALRTVTDFVKRGLMVISQTINKYIKPDVIDLASTVKKHMKLIHGAIQVVVFIVKWLAIIIGGTLVAAIVGAVTAIAAIIRIITITIHVIERVVGWFITFYHWIMNAAHALNVANTAVSRFMTMLWNKVQSVKSTIMNFFVHAGSWLVHAGEQVIMGFVHGLENKLGSVKSTLQGLAGKLTSWKGPPAKDRVMLIPAGRMVIEGFVRGLESRYGRVKKSLQSVNKMLQTGTVKAQLAGPVGSVGMIASRVSQGTTHKTFNQTINVHTQEINPRTQAIKLGWELSNRM